jgi:SAM-dependent methyltransferase
MRLTLLYHKAISILNTGGVPALWHSCLRVISDIAVPQPAGDFDTLHGTETSKPQYLWQYKVSSPSIRFGTRYQASDEEDFLQAIRILEDRIHDFTFVDLGCGKGKALLMAAKFGFRDIVGVEFVDQLCEIARQNLVRMNITKATVLHMDAGDFRFPDADTVLYLFNPFTLPIIKRVVSNLPTGGRHSLYVIYINPRFPEPFERADFLRPVACFHGKEYPIRIWKRDPSINCAMKYVC